MSRHVNRKPKPWSKLQKQLYGLMVSEIGLQIHCNVYRFSDKHFTYDSPRYWITLDKRKIWDYPADFLAWNHPDVPMPIRYLEEGHLDMGRFKPIADLFREYIDSPKEGLIDKEFADDYWG